MSRLTGAGSLRAVLREVGMGWVGGVRGALGLVLLGAACCAGAAEGEPVRGGYEIPFDELQSAARAYLDAKCPKKTLEKMDRKLRDRVAQKLEDNSSLQADSAMRSIMLDWAAGSEAKIRAKEREAIFTACFYFIRFQEQGFQLPWQFRDRLDKKACDEILAYLREETAKGPGEAETETKSGGEGAGKGQREREREEKKGREEKERQVKKKGKKEPERSSGE